MPVEGILPVIPTPLLNGKFDKSSFSRMLDRMLPFVDGYTLLGSTGEAPSFTVSERMEITEWALQETPSDTTVVVGVSSTSAGDARALAKHAEDSGARGVLCSSPFYFANTPRGVHDYLGLLDAVLTVELILYDNPDATKTLLTAEDVVAWSREFSHLQCVKLTDHDLSKIPVWHDAGLRVLAGDDSIAFRYLAAGVDGVMIIAPAVFPRSFRVVWDYVRSGETASAFRVFANEVLPFLHVFGIGDEIASTKQLFEALGIFESAEVLPPLQTIDRDRTDLLKLAFDSADRQARERLATESERAR